MNVKELIEFLKQFPEDMEVVYDKYEDDTWNFISDGVVENGKVHLYEN